MNTKFTPEYVLKMLQEIKKLSDQDDFYFSIITKKYPSFSIFKQILFNKGIISKGRGKAKWISIIPNIIMAKEVSRLFLEKRELYLENWINKKLNESDNQINNEIDNEIDNEIEITKNNIKPISILQENLNPHFWKQDEPMKIDFISYAKTIRKDGEKWNDVVSRASKMMKGIDIITPVKRGRGRPRKTPAITDLSKTTNIDNEKWNDVMKHTNVIPDELKPITNSFGAFDKIIENEKLKKELEELKDKLEFEKSTNNDLTDLYSKSLKQQQHYERESDRWKHEVEHMNVVLHKETKIQIKQNQDLINKLEVCEKDLQYYIDKYTDLEQRNKKYITEYSTFINEKLEVIEDLKKQLHQQQSEKNQISVIKVLGIPLIKKTTKTIK